MIELDFRVQSTRSGEKMTGEEARSIKAYKSQDILVFGCPSFECMKQGGRFKYSGTPEDGAGLWLCHDCRVWIVADSKRKVGELSSIKVGPGSDWFYPIIQCHPVHQEGSVAMASSG